MAEDVRTWVEARRATLAKRAWSFAEKQEIKSKLARMEPTAIRTLLGATIQASCLLEVQMLLRYQQGRDKDKWDAGLVSSLESELTELVSKAEVSSLPEGDRDLASVQLAVAYLGFLVMLHRYYHAAEAESAAAAKQSSAAGREPVGTEKGSAGAAKGSSAAGPGSPGERKGGTGPHGGAEGPHDGRSAQGDRRGGAREGFRGDRRR
ncbi:hypothetical protein WME98_19230 [Sorangium sp. So ce296]|uniref:hypothetical protein n=1 Tax=Sorangium sp. So ce296 TaxID=3133296 RepID=UPI003F6208A9